MHDIHCHILPDIDDGPSGMEESLQMARMAASDGTRVLAATPHGDGIAAIGGREALDVRLRALKDAVRAGGIELEVTSGAEYLLSMELLVEARKGNVIGLNGSRYLLVEIDFSQYPHFTDEAVFQLQLCGYVPVLAHPERQATIQQKPELLEGLVAHGVISEVTAGSFLGDFGRDAQRSAERLLKSNLVHAVASDGHTSTGSRPPVMAEALSRIASLAGEDTARLLGEANPSAILAGRPVYLPRARPAGRKAFRLLGRQRP